MSSFFSDDSFQEKEKNKLNDKKNNDLDDSPIKEKESQNICDKIKSDENLEVNDIIKDSNIQYNEESEIVDDYNEVSKNKNNHKKKKLSTSNYSIDNNEDINEIKNNNEEENVNLGNSYSKISEKDKYKNQKDNNNPGIITPNTSIYNLSDTNNDNNNITITSREKKKKINKEIFEEDIMKDNSKTRKSNISVLDYDTNQNEDEKNETLNINTQTSNVHNDIESDFNNTGDKISNRRNKKHNNIISKRFEIIKKNKKNSMNSSSYSSPMDMNYKNYTTTNKDTTSNNKYLKESILNTINETDEYIYLCPFCNKSTPEIMKLEGVQEDNKKQTLDKIYLSCSCGKYDLKLIDYMSALEKNNYKNTENCYNENHDTIKATAFCSKCNKWFCEQCLIYHRSLLSDHITTPTKIPKFSKCKTHQNDDILYICSKCNTGICTTCKDTTHSEHYFYDISDYFYKTYESLPFKTFEELNEFIEHCNRISEKEKNSYIKYIDDMINKLNVVKNEIIDNYNNSQQRRIAQQNLVKYLFGNFICFNDNYIQIKNMNSINYICPTLFLYNDINFIKNSYNYSIYLKKESFIEINPDRKLNKEQIDNIFKKYKLTQKEVFNTNSSNESIRMNNKKTIEKNDINTFQTESNTIYPTLFKIYNNSGIYYGEINENKRDGIGKQFNNKNEFEGIWSEGNIIKGKAIYYSDQGNIIYEGEFKDGLENGYGEKIYPNNRIYKGIFTNGKIDTKYEIQKKLEISKNDEEN